MRVVLDTNIIVSGIYWSGPPFAILEAAKAKRFQILTSEVLLDELDDVLSRAKFTNRVALLRTLPGRSIHASVQDLVELVNVISDINIVTRDPDDNAVLACALDGGADYVISGDRHLLELGEFAGIQILPPDRFAKQIIS
jgi:putative PIN family toxin of toxin-antitoxin system